MLIKLFQTPNTRTKTKQMSSEKFSSHPLDELSIQKFNRYQERPFKPNSSNLSFEGLFFKPVMDSSKKAVKKFNKDEIIQITKSYIGSNTEKLFNHINDSNQPLKKAMFDFDGKHVTFQKKSILRLVIDGALYPFIQLPKEIINGTVSFLKKIKPLQKWADKMYDKPILKKWRQESKIEAQVNALRGMFETVSDLKAANKTEEEISAELLKRSAKMFDPKTGNYDTKHERSLNRVVSGLIPAVFLANDAYNLSSACGDSTEASKKEQKTRFKQEVSRIGLNAYITLITLGALQKYINNSKAAIMLNTALTVLFTETIARVSNGKPITRLTPEQAKQMNEKNSENKSKSDYNLVPFKSDDKAVAKNKKTIFKGQSKSDEAKKPLLSFSTLLKASTVVIAAGYSVKGLKKIKSLDDAITKSLLSPVKKFYEKLTIDPSHKVDKVQIEKIISVLKENEFDGLAKKYQELANSKTKDGFVLLGKKDKKIKPVVDFVIAPFKFIFNTIKLPYSLTDKLLSMFAKKPPKKSNLQDDAFKAFAQSVDRITQFMKTNKNADPKKFADFVNDSVNKSFNVDNMSNISNSELANLAKTSATAATLWFLMSDNYNMVMLKSNGEDKEGAELKFKERLVQETSRLFYQTLLIDLFNSTFRAQYNNSLWGMSWITASNTFIGEILNRKSVGMPVKPHSRQELIEIEHKKENATGPLKSYYDFMARLTGKKSLSEQRQAHEKKKADVK